MPLPAKQEQYSFADVLTWAENENIEIINGEAFMMAPPSRIHQKISGELFRQLANFLEGKKCEVYPAPFAVRLFDQREKNPTIKLHCILLCKDQADKVVSFIAEPLSFLFWIGRIPSSTSAEPTTKIVYYSFFLVRE